MWVACTREETIQLAAEKGIGVLSFNFVAPHEAKAWADGYYATLQSEACVPVGFAVNANFAVVAPFLCHRDEQAAIDLALEGFDFFRYSGLHYFVAGEHTPGETDLWAASSRSIRSRAPTAASSCRPRRSSARKRSAPVSSHTTARWAHRHRCASSCVATPTPASTK